MWRMRPHKSAHRKLNLLNAVGTTKAAGRQCRRDAAKLAPPPVEDSRAALPYTAETEDTSRRHNTTTRRRKGARATPMQPPTDTFMAADDG